MKKVIKMAEQTKTRIEKLIPDYGKLKFVNKEEKGKEDELSGMGKKDKVVWRQLESQAHMANEQLERASDSFQAWLEEYEEVQDMIVVQKALNVTNTFGRLLLALDSERQFVLSILKSYLTRIKELEVPEKKIEKKVVSDIKIEKKKLTRSAIELDIIEKWQRGVSTKELAKTHDMGLRVVQKIIAKYKKSMKKKYDSGPLEKKMNDVGEISSSNKEIDESDEESEDYEDKFIKEQEG